MDTQPLAYMSQEFLESGDARPLRIMSGVGREGVRFAIEEMTNLKLVCFNLE